MRRARPARSGATHVSALRHVLARNSSSGHASGQPGPQRGYTCLGASPRVSPELVLAACVGPARPAAAPLLVGPGPDTVTQKLLVLLHYQSSLPLPPRSHVSPHPAPRTQSPPTRAVFPSPSSSPLNPQLSRLPPGAPAMFPPDLAKTHEILARLRPIAPKPPQNPPAAPLAAPLRFRTRPSRARKRGRGGLLPVPFKHNKTSAAADFSAACSEKQSLALSLHPPGRPLVERDLLQKLQEPKLIAPRPVRPVGSSISVGSISEGFAAAPLPPAAPKRAEEVEEEVESETLPAVISDSNNRVRLANSAYKELVGQPECLWLETMEGAGGGRRGLGLGPATRRINGEVMMEFSDSGPSPGPPAASWKGFSCRVKIEWACNGRRSFVDAPCEAIRVYCESKDYVFTWRFHTGEAYRRSYMI
ncbi:hypothetical protein AXF42_Ash015966 [Apostasia shenzhenica]|uniref:Uncharacterized protein n=1 Tax=Apostasia shenzhenica TaxID=1088818 RepID=A0A2I0AWI7_9ASPA|nr:hypothetical protein AXF42_Ash015966 [Apostasia shenzhenica]